MYVFGFRLLVDTFFIVFFNGLKVMSDEEYNIRVQNIKNIEINTLLCFILDLFTNIV